MMKLRRRSQPDLHRGPSLVATARSHRLRTQVLRLMVVASMAAVWSLSSAPAHSQAGERPPTKPATPSAPSTPGTPATPASPAIAKGHILVAKKETSSDADFLGALATQ